MTDFVAATAPEAYLQERLSEAVGALKAAHKELAKAGYGQHFELLCAPDDCWLMRAIAAARGDEKP